MKHILAVVLLAGMSLPVCAQQPAALPSQDVALFRSWIALHWTPRAGRPPFIVHVRLNRDGTLIAPPALATLWPDEATKRDFDRASAAIVKGQPYTMFRQEDYDRWKSMELVMDGALAQLTPPAPREPSPTGERPKFDPAKIKALIERERAQRR